MARHTNTPADPADIIGRMEPYGFAHLAALACAVLAACAFIAVARRTRGTRAEDRALTVTGWVMLAATLAWMIWNVLPGNWNVEQSLPVHLSDGLRVITALALLTRRGPFIAISYFWGLTLNIQSVITPDLIYFHNVPFEYVSYWFFHIMALVVPIMFVWGLGYRPSWRGYGIALAATLGWACYAGVVNAITGANYMYIARAPEVASAIDLLGPWPVYIVWELVLVTSVWALITWPWNRGRALEAPLVGRWRAVRRRPSAG